MRKERRRCRFLFPFLFLGLIIPHYSVEQARGQTVVTFPTEDGLTIYATLHLPKTPRPSVAGVVLFSEPEWIIRATYDGTNLARELAEKYGMAALTADFRGTAGNVHGRPFQTFSPKELEKLQLDIRGAVKFLSSQKGVDPQRIGVVAVGMGANYAALEASENPSVKGLVLISGTLSDRARDFLKARSDIPIFCLAGKDDKEAFKEMTEAFYLSKNKDSNIVVAVGHGTVMFSHTKGLTEQISRWLADNVKGLGVEKEISFNTEDGWSLHGRLRAPDVLDNNKVPGVVLVHGAQHDQETYDDLTRALAKRGVATLTYDWRGKNRDIKETRGHYGVNLPAEERDKTHLDVKAAINYMASQPSVDANRIGMVAATLGTLFAVHGAAGDARIKTMVMLTQYVPDDAAKRFFTTTDIPIFFIASSEDLNYELGSLAEATRDSYRMSKNKFTEFLLYDDAGRGSEMLKRKDELEPMIVRWFAEKLAK